LRPQDLWLQCRFKLALKELAKQFIGFTRDELDNLIKSGELIEVGDDYE